jgi:hypothetical protein
MIIFGLSLIPSPDGHLWLKREENDPFPCTRLMAIYGAMSIYAHDP